MNRLLTKKGGQPIWLEDIAFMQESVIIDISTILNSLSQGADCVLTGCYLDDNSITSGYLLYKGEILKLDRGELSTTEASYISRSVTYGGKRKMKSGSEEYCWEFPKAIITTEPTTTQLTRIKEGKLELLLPNIRDRIPTSRVILHAYQSDQFEISVYRTGMSRIEIEGWVKVTKDPGMQHVDLGLDDIIFDRTSILGCSNTTLNIARVTIDNSSVWVVPVDTMANDEEYFSFQAVLIH